MNKDVCRLYWKCDLRSHNQTCNNTRKCFVTKINENMKEVVFTHYWVTDFGWENTIYQPSDFKEIEELGKNDIDGFIFYGKFSKSGKTHILKGYYKP